MNINWVKFSEQQPSHGASCLVIGYDKRTPGVKGIGIVRFGYTTSATSLDGSEPYISIDVIEHWAPVKELIDQINQPTHDCVCELCHAIMKPEKMDIDGFIRDIKSVSIEDMTPVANDNISIRKLGLSVRTVNVLMRHGIKTVKELKKFDDQELLNLRRFGVSGLMEVHKALNSH